MPANNYLKIENIPYNQNDIAIINQSGQIMLHTTSNETQVNLDVKQIPNGVYVVRIKSGNQTFYKKIVIEESK